MNIYSFKKHLLDAYLGLGNPRAEFKNKGRQIDYFLALGRVPAGDGVLGLGKGLENKFLEEG